MDGLPIFWIALIAAVIALQLSTADHEYMLNNSDAITVPIGFETVLQCLMNIEPDKFQWKFYPLSKKDAFNPRAILNLGKSRFSILPSRNFTSSRRQSDLTIKADSKEIAGDYQCLAYYGASVVASVPWRITIKHLGEFPPQRNLELTVKQGNTINWRCEAPESNPEAQIEYAHNNRYLRSNERLSKQSLILTNVTNKDSGIYTCSAYSLEFPKQSTTTFTLKVVDHIPYSQPEFIVPLKKIYTVNKGQTVFLECSAIGNPIPKVIWKKQNGNIPDDRAELIPSGLIIRNVNSSDDGTYTCHHTNNLGQNVHHITLIYNEEPIITCLENSTDIKQGEHLDLECTVEGGTPEPQISWFLNGFSVNNDSAIEAVGNIIYFRPVEKRHAGNLQIFAQNRVKTVYKSISIRVIPLSTSVDDLVTQPTRPHHRHNKGNGTRKNQKHPKIVPPTKPNITRLNDEAVVVRWSVPNNKGLPIQFFKVQYRDLGPINQHDPHRSKSSKWMTSNVDIPPHIRSYEVDNLQPDHIYRFRIAAVYSNNDNKDSPNSEKFYLKRMDFDNRNPLPVPMITRTEPINSTAVKIYWKCDLNNMTIDGYFINYISASSAADYLKATVDGQHTMSYILSHLQPETVYDIKLQSFTSKSASEFSSIMKAKTLGIISTPSPVTETTPNPHSASSDSPGISKLYIMIAIGVIVGGSTIVLSVVTFLYCRKWKQKKNNRIADDRDKPGVEDHHIQADGSEYVVGPKSQSRVNGVVPPNRITITANPLADADNKNQNMMEMSCLSSQNNNCSPTTTTVPTVASASCDQETIDGSSITKDNNKKHNNKNRDKRNMRNKNNLETITTSGENYV